MVQGININYTAQFGGLSMLQWNSWMLTSMFVPPRGLCYIPVSNQSTYYLKSANI